MSIYVNSGGPNVNHPRLTVIKLKDSLKGGLSMAAEFNGIYLTFHLTCDGYIIGRRFSFPDSLEFPFACDRCIIDRRLYFDGSLGVFESMCHTFTPSISVRKGWKY